VNDPDRRRSPDGFDDDAIFADIVAHLNDDVIEAGERAAQPATEDAAAQPATDAGTTDATSEQANAESRAETTAEPTDQPPSDRRPPKPSQWYINPPPWLPPHAGPEADPQASQADSQADSQAEPQAVPAPQLWRAHEVDDEYEEHFEPPPVTPLPAGDLQFWGIIVGMCGGPLLLLYLVLFNRDASSYWVLGAIAMSVGGFALLVSRMPGHHGEDDDGARL
jgi:hypothetical protein